MLLYLWVTIRQEKLGGKGLEKESFWNWNNFSNYLLFITTFGALTGATTVLLRDVQLY